MADLTDLKLKADLWWAERKNRLTGLFRNPLFIALGVRVRHPDSQTIHLRLPWGKPQRLLASEIPLSMILGAAEMALQLHIKQWQVYSQVQVQLTGAEIEHPKRLDEAVEIRVRSTWEEWEELRLEIAKEQSFEKEFTLPLWSDDDRILGRVILRAQMWLPRLLPA